MVRMIVAAAGDMAIVQVATKGESNGVDQMLSARAVPAG